jgi:hypothetical protein
VENILQGPAFAATSGSLSGLLTAQTVINGVASGYIYQPLPSIGETSGGTAVYNFTITNAGNYEIQALANAPNANANSFYVNIDGQPQDPTMIWDIMPPTPGFEQRIVSWRGNGSENNDQIVPKTFNLGAGPHQIIFVGGQPGTALAGFTLLQVAQLAQPQTTLATPSTTALPLMIITKKVTTGVTNLIILQFKTNLASPTWQAIGTFTGSTNLSFTNTPAVFIRGVCSNLTGSFTLPQTNFLLTIENP